MQRNRGSKKHKSKKSRKKRNHRTPWRSIHRRISGVALTAFVDPSNTSRKYSGCEYVVKKTQEGHIFKCPRCDLKMDRHKVASINIRRRHLEGKRREE